MNKKFLLLGLIATASIVNCDCQVFSNGKCGTKPEINCEQKGYVQDSQNTCVRCIEWKENACGKKDAPNLCLNYEQTSNNFCQLKCSINTQLECGLGNYRCKNYQQIDNYSCIDCTSLKNNECGGSQDQCSSYYFDKNQGKCLLKCDFTGDQGICGEDSQRCNNYRPYQRSSKCVDCTTFANGFCGGIQNATQCADSYIKSNDKNFCIKKCHIVENKQCGGDSQRCKHFQQVDGNFCTNCLEYIRGKGCGNGDYGLCLGYYKESENSCTVDCSTFLNQKCGGQNNVEYCKNKEYMPFTEKGSKECVIPQDSNSKLMNSSGISLLFLLIIYLF